MRAATYLAGYVFCLYMGSREGAAVFFMMLFTTMFLKHSSRLQWWWLRVPLATVLFPFRLLDYLLIVAWHAPSALLTLKPYLMTWVMYLATINGQFVPREKK